MNNEEVKAIIGNVLGGVTEDGGDYGTRVKLMDSNGVTDNVIQKLADNNELQGVLDMIEAYQNEDVTDDDREVLYERTDKLVYGALRDLYPHVEEITNSSDGWGNGVFSQYLKTL